MKAGRLHLGLPVLAKELTEQAARRRTYVIRTIYALLLFAVAGLQIVSLVGYITRDPLQVLGQGGQLFSFLVGLQFIGIYLFMPALVCGVVTAEKERNSLGLLFLTRLGPWTILIEKLASRLVPMFTFLLLSLPVLAFAYALGGISLRSLWLAVWYLVITVLQVGALGLACSAYFRTTPSALIACYLLGMTMYFAPPILQAFELVRFDFLLSSVLQIVGLPDVILARSPELSMLLFGPFVFFGLVPTLSVWQALLVSIPMLLSVLFWLGMARLCVVRRAFVTSGHPLIRLFNSLDRFFTALNNRLTRGVVLIHDRTALPADQPVAWRETSKKSLGKGRYLLRILLVFEAPLILYCLLATADDALLPMISVIVLLLWIAVGLIVTVSAANLVAGERARQTFDVLLATPITGRQLVEQKFRGIRRLMLVLSVPLVTLFLFQCSWRGAIRDAGRDSWVLGGFSDTALYLVCSFLSVIVYLPLAAWMSFFIALKIHSQGKAIVASLAAVVLWVLFPFVVIFPIIIVCQVFLGFPINGPPEELMFTAFLLSPVWLVPVNEFAYWEDLRLDVPAVQVTLHFMLQTAVLFAFRHRCLDSADRLLGRE